MTAPRYAVARNLHRSRAGAGQYSLRQRAGGRVVGYAAAVLLEDVTLRVPPAGLERVRRRGQREVFAYAVGAVAELDGVQPAGAWVRVTFDPFRHDSFVDQATGAPVTGARRLYLGASGAWAEGPC